MNQLRKDLRDAYNRYVMAEHEFKILRQKANVTIRELGKALRKRFSVPAGSWLKTQKIACKDGAAGIGLVCSFSSTDQRMIENIAQELTDRGWIIYDTSIFLKHTEIKAY